MKINKIEMIYYSPTGTTKQILEYIAEGITSETIEQIDLTPPNSGSHEVSADLTLIGVPVYGGRVSLNAAERLKKVKGNNSLSVAVAVFGNRAYEDALIELRDLSVELGYKPIAGGAFVAQHSWQSKYSPSMGSGRPDESDIEKAMAFGRKIREKVENIQSLEDAIPIDVPGDFPYKERGVGPPPISPSTEEDVCIKCGKCVEVCPVGVITLEDKVVTRSEGCTLCHACIKYCPTNARVFPEIYEQQKKYFSDPEVVKRYSDRKELETYL